MKLVLFEDAMKAGEENVRPGVLSADRVVDLGDTVRQLQGRSPQERMQTFNRILLGGVIWERS